MPRSPLYNGNIQRVCRNVETHISENSAKYNLVGVALPGFVVLNHVHADIMIMARFGPWFEEFQNNLFDISPEHSLLFCEEDMSECGSN
ncbi:hypothetical protein OROGR_029135 [Orobanche gracilis]